MGGRGSIHSSCYCYAFVSLTDWVGPQQQSFCACVIAAITLLPLTAINYHYSYEKFCQSWQDREIINTYFHTYWLTGQNYMTEFSGSDRYNCAEREMEA